MSEADHVLGNPEASVTLVVYGDYQCPYTGIAFHTVARIMKILGDQVAYVYRNFPLTDIHPEAFLAAEAAEAADEQGKFWAMHETILKNQAELGEEDLIQYAARLGMDPKLFFESLRQHRYASRVQKDLQTGAQSGVEETPTFFINGKKFTARADFPSLRLAIEAALAQSAQASQKTA